MKKNLLVVVILLTSFYSKAQDYTTIANTFQRYYNAQQMDSVYNMFSNEAKAMLSAQKWKEIYTQLGEIKSLTPDGQQSYKAVFPMGTLKMLLSVDKNNLIDGLRFLPYQAPKDTDNVILGDLRGTLTLPTGNKKVPVVLILAGSGPTDRNGNSGADLYTNSYKMIAEDLPRNGIACLRFDKRLTKKDGPLTFEDLITDAEALITMLQKDARFSKVYVAGHSEGSLVGMIAAAGKRAAGFISLAGAGRPVNILIEEQLKAQSPEAAAVATVLLDSLKQGHTVTPPAYLISLFNKDVQPFLMSWLKYSPAQEISKLKMPVLLIQGTTDLQVSTTDAALLKKAKPDATLKEIPEMNHILKEAPSDRTANFATYKNPDLPLKSELMPVLIFFIKTNTAL